MTTQDGQSTATQSANKEEQASSQQASLAPKNQEGSVTRQPRSGLFGLPLMPYEMLRMTPFSLLRRMAEELDSALLPGTAEREGNARVAWTPVVEVSERDGQLRILAELPGLSPNDVRVEVEDDALILQGEREEEREATEGGVRRSERQFGFFYRRIPLPEGVDPEQAKAQFHDGVLEITMPAPNRESKRRQIQIEAGSKPASGEEKRAA
jgi:HSP20 family protein